MTWRDDDVGSVQGRAGQIVGELVVTQIQWVCGPSVTPCRGSWQQSSPELQAGTH